MTPRTTAEFVSYLANLDVKLFVEKDSSTSDPLRLRCNAPEGILNSELRQELAIRKAELIAYLHERKDERQDHSITPSPHYSSTSFPLSFAQQRLWFLYQLSPHNPFYNVPAAIRLTGTLDLEALERSFREIVRRHAALRTRFTTVDGEPVQVVDPHTHLELAVVDLQTVALSERERMGEQLASAEAQRPFNLTTDALIRLTLLKFDETESMLLLTMHHIVADGWSLGVLIRELGECYSAFVGGRLPSLPPLPIQYTDFARWQRNWLQGDVLAQQLAYWCQQLADLSPLELPCDRPRPAVQTYHGATVPLQIAPTLTQLLIALSQDAGVSLFMVLLAAFQVLLYRYTGQEDLAIGSPIANRHRSEVEGLIGFFVNSLVLRSDLSGNPTFRELVERVRDVALEAYEHQDLPFEKLVEELDPERDLSRNPLFQVAFALQNAPMQALELPGLTLNPLPLVSSSTRFDLEVHLWEPAHGLRSLWQSQEGISGFISYSTDLFDRDRIARLVGHFQTLLEGIIANPDARLSELPLLTEREIQQIGEWCRSPFASLDRDKAESDGSGSKKEREQPRENGCFHQIFERQVEQNPEAIALVSEHNSLTYAELNHRADQLAGMLQQMGVQANSLTGLCVERSADMLVGILAILKAGGSYVPLDPTLPSDRLQFLLTDTQVKIVLTQSGLVESLPNVSAHLVCLDQIDFSTVAAALPAREDLTADSLAYVIYTSGSTGTPKGVLLSHQGLCNVVAAQQQVFHLSRTSRVLQFSSLSFDASIFEVALALGSGATLYIPPQAAQLPGMALLQFLQANAITHALLTPAVLAVLPAADLPDLQVLITGGEACSSQVVDRWAANRHFFNAYGPTETTIWATVAELHPGDKPLIIGRPILNTQVYILDAHLNPVPAGVPGEIYIGGVGLAQGYLNRPELTQERFIPVEFLQRIHPENSKNSVLYKTGDRAQYHSDGAIEFLGRVDNQIKIRGFRVELGEIEATLQRHAAIQDAVVLAAGETSHEMRLNAYFSLDEQYLQTRLHALEEQHIQYWQTLYNQTYQARQSVEASTFSENPSCVEDGGFASVHHHPHFDITGWNSSYTGEPIPLEEMQEWVGDRVQQILSLKPKRVLEIGCGTGLLLFQIAPHCQSYVGTDFSSVSLASIQHQLDHLELSHVELLQRMAVEFEGIELGSFDVVILNSVVQYFPSAGYLMQVLEKAIRAVAPGGVLFIGDVRSLPLLTAFHAWMKFGQADDSLHRMQLRHQVERSQFEDPELAIDPALFYALRDRLPQIAQVQIRLSRGHHQNEMTQFRYNVLLHLHSDLSDPSLSRKNISFSDISLPQDDQRHRFDWEDTSLTVEVLKHYLIAHEPEIVLITNIPNCRVKAAVKVATWLRHNESPKTVGRMREMLKISDELAIAPQEWWNLEQDLPYRVEVTWSAQTDTGEYDVLLIRQGVQVETCQIQHSQPQEHYTNNPLQSTAARQLIPELRHYLKQTLPDYMVPSAFVPLDTLPRSSSGKVDRRALPLLLDDRPQPSTTAPLTPTESILIDIWRDLLRLKHLTKYDNFFELGGHSLLATQMASRVRDSLDIELPLKKVFEAPTIAQLASLLDVLRETSATPMVPPIVRLDRSAYRRQRSQLSSVPSNLPAPGVDSSDSQHSPSKPSLLDRSPLIPLTLGDNTQPFFCVHPMFGVVFPYLELAHHLDDQRSFYGLQPLGLDGKTPPLTRIEAIATAYIQAIQALQPHGPYLLGGWSFGGLVAYEMAQQLTQSGQKVELLAILDTPAPCHKPSLCQSLKFLVGTAFWSTLPFLVDYGVLASHRLEVARSWFANWQWSAIARSIPEEARLPLLDESAIRSLLPIVYANSQAAYRYVPQPYPHRLTLFKATEQPDSLKDEPVLGWNGLVNDIQVHEVPGNHLSLLKHPHVEILAQHLRQYLS